MKERAREEGFSLIELLVAISLIGVIMTGLAFGLTTALGVTRDSRERTIAANLASQEIDLAHAAPVNNLKEGTFRRAERVGATTFTVLREARWEEGRVDAIACTALANSATGRGRRFLAVNVTVTWDGVGLRGPVRASTAITPSVASYREGFGHVAIEVKDRDARAVQAITVTLSGNGVTRVVTTTSIGCAFFSDVPPGTYTVSVNQPGYVDADPADRAQLGSEIVAVADRETTKGVFIYDRRADLDLTLASPDGGEVPDGVFAVAEANAATSFQRYSGLGSGGSPRRRVGTAPAEGLFPYSGGWNAWAGCDHNDPEGYGGARVGLTPGPGQTASGAVPVGTLRMRIDVADASRANQTLYALDQVATPGSPCATRIAVGTFSSSGTLSRNVVLPFGDWRLYVGMDTAFLDVDRTLTSPPGLIRVRPGLVATYTQPLTYRGGVLAQGPFLYYRLDETPSFAARDSSGNSRNGTYQSGALRGAPGALTGEDSRAAYLDGTTNAYVSSSYQLTNPTTFSLEVWFSTTSTTGGKLLGFGNSQTGTSTSYDRHLYLLNGGQVVFGVYPGAYRTIQSPAAYNDGAWHHAVATLSAAGMQLYVDGQLVASRADVTTAQSFTGWFRVGYDKLSTGWPGTVSNAAFSGVVDEFAYYPTALPAGRVSAHYNARGAAYSTAVQADAPALQYRFDDGIAQDSSGNNRDGAYQTGTAGGAAGALLSEPASTAVTFDGTANAAVANPAQVSSPTAFTLEAWFRTTSTLGGRIVGFGNASTGTSTSYDRHLYLTNAGQVVFGVHPSSRFTITSPGSYRDGQWHHVVATYQASGMALYVDGDPTPVATRGATASGTAYDGYWRVGADTLASWGSQPSDAALNGTVDEVAVYHTVLTAQQVRVHYTASGR